MAANETKTTGRIKNEGILPAEAQLIVIYNLFPIAFSN